MSHQPEPPAEWWRNRALAHRLLLAKLTADDDAYDRVADEIGHCAGCWEAVTQAVAGTAADYAAELADALHYDMIAALEQRIAHALDRQLDSGNNDDDEGDAA